MFLQFYPWLKTTNRDPWFSLYKHEYSFTGVHNNRGSLNQVFLTPNIKLLLTQQVQQELLEA